MCLFTVTVEVVKYYILYYCACVTLFNAAAAGMSLN